MKLSGKVIVGSKAIKEITVENYEAISFRDALEDCFIRLCRDLDIPVPLWIGKNTKEFSAFRKTFFSSEQFVEKVKFDKFEISLNEE